MREFDDNTLSKFLRKLDKDELYLLDQLYKDKNVTSAMSITKEEIATLLNITTFKATSIIDRLEVLGLLSLGAGRRPVRYYISEDGIRILKLFAYELSLKERV